MLKLGMVISCALLLALVVETAHAYPQNLLSKKLGASVSTTAKVSGTDDPNNLMNDGPVSRGGFLFANVEQPQVAVVDLGQLRTFDRIQLGTGGGAKTVKISVTAKSADGPYKEVYSNDEVAFWQICRLPLVKARWVKFDFGVGSGTHFHSTRIYMGYKHPKLAQVTKLLYERIRPGIPGMEKFYAAGKKADWPKACKALRAYWAKKLPDEFGIDPKYDLKRAQDIFDGKHDHAGIQHVDKHPVDWSYMKTTDWYEYKNFINRGAELGVPLDALVASGDPKWLRFFRDTLYDWIDENPKPVIMSRADYPSWRTLDSGARLGWLYTRFPKATHAKQVEDELWANLLFSIWEHADYLKNDDFDGGNWLANVMGAVMATAMEFPEFADQKRWLEFGKTSYETNVLRDIYPDGKEVEDAPGYIAFAYNPMLGTLEQLDKAGIEVSKESRERLSKTATFLAAITGPDGNMPPFGDWGGGQGAYSLPRAQKYFKREDVKYVLTKGKEGTRPEWCSINFPQGQWSVMRSPFEEQPYENARFLVFKTSSGSHGHNDILNMTAYAYGRELLTDPGIRSYEHADVLLYLHTNYHNTICVDGQNQSRGGGKTEKWFSNPGMDYVLGTSVAYKALTARRGIVFVKPDYWIVLDSVIGEGDHTYDQNWHFPVDASPVEDSATKAVHTSYPKDGNLLMVPVDTDGLTSKVKDFLIAKDRMEKDQQGVESKGWTYARKGAPPQTMDLVLYPYNGTQVPNVSVKRLKVEGAPDATALQVDANGSTDYVFVSRTGPVTASIPEVRMKVEGEIVVLRVKNGKPARVSGANVKTVTLGDRDIVGFGAITADVDKTME